MSSSPCSTIVSLFRLVSLLFCVPNWRSWQWTVLRSPVPSVSSRESASERATCNFGEVVLFLSLCSPRYVNPRCTRGARQSPYLPLPPFARKPRRPPRRRSPQSRVADNWCVPSLALLRAGADAGRVVVQGSKEALSLQTTSVNFRRCVLPSLVCSSSGPTSPSPSLSPSRRC